MCKLTSLYFGLLGWRHDPDTTSSNSVTKSLSIKDAFEITPPSMSVPNVALATPETSYKKSHLMLLLDRIIV